MNNLNFELITIEDAIAKYKCADTENSGFWIEIDSCKDDDQEYVAMIIKDDLVIETSIDNEKYFDEIIKDSQHEKWLKENNKFVIWVIIEGSLTIKGNLLTRISGSYIYVSENLTAESIMMKAQTGIRVKGNLCVDWTSSAQAYLEVDGSWTTDEKYGFIDYDWYIENGIYLGPWWFEEDKNTATYDPKTLHGTHYNKVDFDEDVQRVYNRRLERNANATDDEKRKILEQTQYETYCQMNLCSAAQFEKWKEYNK